VNVYTVIAKFAVKIVKAVHARCVLFETVPVATVLAKVGVHYQIAVFA